MYIVNAKEKRFMCLLWTRDRYVQKKRVKVDERQIDASIEKKFIE